MYVTENIQALRGSDLVEVIHIEDDVNEACLLPGL